MSTITQYVYDFFSSTAMRPYFKHVTVSANRIINGLESNVDLTKGWNTRHLHVHVFCVNSSNFLWKLSTIIAKYSQTLISFLLENIFWTFPKVSWIRLSPSLFLTQWWVKGVWRTVVSYIFICPLGTFWLPKHYNTNIIFLLFFNSLCDPTMWTENVL
jgi:hypothetical protein